MIPTVDDLCSTPMVHKQGDVFNPPGLTNFLGTVQTDVDLTGIMNMNFPPYSCGNGKTGALYIDGIYFASTGNRVTTTWYPHKIVRSAFHCGLEYITETVLKTGGTAALVKITVKNPSCNSRVTELRLGLHGAVVRKDSAWRDAAVPRGEENGRTLEPSLGGFIYQAPEGDAFLIQGVYPAPERIDGRGITSRVEVSPGREKSIYFCVSLGGTRDEAEALHTRTIQRGDEVIGEAGEEWNRELTAVFTPATTGTQGTSPSWKRRMRTSSGSTIWGFWGLSTSRGIIPIRYTAGPTILSCRHTGRR